MFKYFKYKLTFWRGLSHRFLLIGFVLFAVSGNLLAAGLKLAWDAPTNGPAPAGYKVYYGTSSGNYSSSVDAGNATTVTISDVTVGSTYYFASKSYDAAGNQSTYSNEVTATVPVPLAVDFTANPNASLVPNQLVNFQPTTVTPSTATISSWSWSFGSGASIPSSTAQVPTISFGSAGTYSVTLTVSDSTGKTATKTNTITVLAPSTPPPAAGFTSSTTALSANFTDTSTGSISSWTWNFGDPSSSTNTSTAQNSSHIYSASGTYPVTLTVMGSGGTNTTTSSISVSAPINGGTNGGGKGTTLSGPVAAYGFDETTGVIAVDASGFGNHGDIQKAVRIANGRFGNALKFDGVNEGVVVNNGNNSQSLALSTGMTLEAWVYPTAEMDGGRTIITKVQSEPDYTEAYRLVANDTTNQPMSTIWSDENPVSVVGNTQILANQWSHLATTYDGQYQTLYINGVLVKKIPQTGVIPTSNGSLRIGYNAAWGYSFQGYIDEVRIYNRALNNMEIINDTNTAISVSNPPQFVVGNKNVESTVQYNQPAVIRAFQITPQETKMVTNIQVYLDAGSTARNLAAGIYSANTQGRPLKLLTYSSTLTALKAGAGNSIPIKPMYLMAGQTYWIAIQGGASGSLNLRSQPGTGLTETGFFSRRENLLTSGFPAIWSGNPSINELVSIYGAGY